MGVWYAQSTRTDYKQSACQSDNYWYTGRRPHSANSDQKDRQGHVWTSRELGIAVHLGKWGKTIDLLGVPKWLNHSKFQGLDTASLGTQDLKSFGEADRLEFESRGLIEETLDLEFESSWPIIRNGMAIQEREVPGNIRPNAHTPGPVTRHKLTTSNR